MKSQFFKSGRFALVAVLFPLVGGCEQQAGKSPSLVTVASAEPGGVAVAESSAAPAPAVPEVSADPPEKAEPVPAALEEEKPLPPTIKSSGPVAEVIKLAQAGVDESVMLTFITNSTSTFGLSSDEIIYLNDIGVPNTVVTAMIERDQATKQLWTNAAQAQAVATPAPETNVDQAAAAPSYTAPLTDPQQDIVNNNYFYDTLSPYGSWVNVDGYGLCWQPTVVVVNRSWQPYSDRGRWVYTDCGWYWLSDYSWGATTFHYGRWFSHPRWGWCWWPDRVWGPSWVTWRSGGDYCGWAPLPPFSYYQPGFGFSFHGRSVGFSFDFGIRSSCYTFVPFSRFCDPNPYRHRFGSHQVTQVFNKTTIINNFGAGSRNTVVNHGIAPDRISAVTKTEIRKVSIRDAGPSVARGTRGERLERDGRSLTVHRPNIPESRNELRRSASLTGGKASASSPLQTPREAGQSSRSVKGRSTIEDDRTPARSTARVAPTENTAGPSTATATVGSRSAPSSKSGLEPTRGSRNEDSQRGQDRRQGSSIVRGSDTTSQSAPTTPAPMKPTAPASSLVVIGKRDASQPRDRGNVDTSPAQIRRAEAEPRDTQARSTTPTPAPQSPATRPTPSRNQFSQPAAPYTQPQQPAPARSYNPSPSAPSPGIARQEIPRNTRNTEDRGFSRPSPSYSSPAPSYSAPAPTPRYSPQPSAPAPSPRYDRSPPPSYQQSAPRSAPAPSYSPPPSSQAPVQRSQPSPPSRSESGGGGSKGRNH